MALAALVATLLRKPRRGWMLALIALLVPLGIFAALGYVRGQAADIPPIHDIATDVANPPAFSQAAVDRRNASGANPLNDYTTPLGELDMWAQTEAPLANQSHAQVITQAYPDLVSLPIGTADRAAAVAAVAEAMEELGRLQTGRRRPRCGPGGAGSSEYNTGSPLTLSADRTDRYGSI